MDPSQQYPQPGPSTPDQPPVASDVPILQQQAESFAAAQQAPANPYFQATNGLQTPLQSEHVFEAPGIVPAGNIEPIVKDPGKKLALVAVILSIVVAPAGIVFGIIAMKKSRDAGYVNKLARVAVIIGAILFILGMIGAVYGEYRYMEYKATLNTKSVPVPIVK